jgi:NAD(P)-dependent dehydrogenase (short-subunit alcohol dehydrogenase family)
MATDTKVALITGANKGIGLEIARQLGHQGITVVIGSRDPQKGQAAVDTLKAGGLDAHTLKLEVTDAADRDAALAFFQQLGRLDILVNNAGVLLDFDYETGAISPATPQMLNRTYESNVVAPYSLTEVLLPLLKAAPAGRVVHQSSILGSLATVAAGTFTPDYLTPAYASSKAALNMLGVMQSETLKGTKVKVNIAHPGSVKTDMNPMGDLTVEEGAKTAVMLATLPDDGPTGGYFHLGETLPW